ncbi:MAG: class I SAM-dependent methyltransferase [Erythrobacter sp.]|jgi:SAM-dependent methyltransferase|nr:class I SAM-dependent methyltransferase [Erythrobacter sp.]
MNQDDRPIALAAYEALAQAYSERAETKAENGYNEHPAIRRVIGEVAGLAVLDAGCGPGFLTRDLLAGGAARVAALDVSPAMVAIARERAGPHAEIRIADMAQPLDWLADASFDLVASSLAIDYVRDWSRPLGEFARVLRPSGRLVFSVQHPMGAWQWYRPPSAFGVHLCEAMWKNFTPEPVAVPDYYRSFEEIVNPLLAAGFALRGLHETRPVPALEAIDPERFRRHSIEPTFMVIDAALA